MCACFSVYIYVFVYIYDNGTCARECLRTKAPQIRNFPLPRFILFLLCPKISFNARGWNFFHTWKRLMPKYWDGKNAFWEKQLDGRTHRAKSRESHGGVGRNVTDAMIALGLDNTKLLTVVGNDSAGHSIRNRLGDAAEQIQVLPDAVTPR